MTDPPLTPEQSRLLAGDRRRAAAAIHHYMQDDFRGLEAVLDEAKEVDRVWPWIVMILDCLEELTPGLKSETGVRFLQRHIARMAAMENAS